MTTRRSIFQLVGGLAAAQICGLLGVNRSCQADPDLERRNLSDQIIAVDRAWAKAVVARDRAGTEQFLDDPFIATDGTGHIWDRGRYLDGIVAEISRLISIESDEYDVRLLDGFAVVTGRLVYNSTRHDLKGPYRFTKVFVQRDGRWVCAALHEGRIS